MLPNLTRKPNMKTETSIKDINLFQDYNQNTYRLQEQADGAFFITDVLQENLFAIFEPEGTVRNMDKKLGDLKMIGRSYQFFEGSHRGRLMTLQGTRLNAIKVTFRHIAEDCPPCYQN